MTGSRSVYPGGSGLISRRRGPLAWGGATEGTVWSIYYPIEQVTEFQTSIPYGRPIANNYFYILDGNLKVVPKGVAGELYIGGVGVARGYMNDEEKTRAAFLKNRFVDSPRNGEPPPNGEPSRFGEPPRCEREVMMYKTGDLGRMLPDNTIEFLGRMDHQVKIRGFRVELGEIESKLLKNPAVKDAVVADQTGAGGLTGEAGSKYLCAYIVWNEEQTVARMREYLAKELPEYMIPSYFISIDQIPLTANGKVDRKTLASSKGPQPGEMIRTDASAPGREYEAPRNETEANLAAAWQEVLGFQNIGINDNFFEIGGDSIKAMLITSSLKKQGLKLDIKNLFQQQTIKKLEPYIEYHHREVKQEIVTGAIDLIQSQKGFFKKTRTDVNHWNISVMLFKEDRFEETAVAKVFRKIVEHHDALRIVFRMEGEQVTQYNRGLEGELFELKVFELRDDGDDTTRMDEEMYGLQKSLDLKEGPLVKLGLFKRQDGDHLLIIIHHLVGDGISMRLILEDFVTGYRQAVRSETIQLPDKTSSFKDWSKQLSVYANSQALLQEIDYWKELEEQRIPPLPKDRFSSENRRQDDETVSAVLLSAQETETLLKEVNSKFATDVKDLLLTAFGASIKEWTGANQVLVDYMIHGREDIFKDIDVTRTVGWFATIYPVILDMSHLHDLAFQIKSIKAMLRNVPGRGLGYETLREITLPQNKKPLKFNLNAEILFNYSGDFNHSANGIFNGFSFSPLSQPFHESPNSERRYTLYIELNIMMGQLNVTVHYNRHEYYESTMAGLVDSYRKNLLRFIKAEQGIVKGEFGLLPIPTQFFTRNFPDKHHWNIFNLLYTQENIDETAFIKAISKVVEHHDALRIVFQFEGNSIRQYNRGLDEGELFSLKVVDLRNEKKDTE
ncbi:MAG TPA: condensation domain-containing protein, partial [Bacillota bacterium]|nr:condensation domain-containing protein [Bacillota bacterium]